LQSVIASPHGGILCAGCGGSFQPSRPNQRHCRPSCRVLALTRRRLVADTLPWDAPAPQTQTERVAAYFLARPGRWIPGPELVKLGYGGWRTEISRLRHPPWNLPIGPPRYVTVVLASGKRVRITEYRLTRAE